MNSRPSPILLLLFLICLLLFEIPLSLSYDCSIPFNCGNIRSVNFPFWGGDRPEGCGYPELQLSCNNDVATIEIMKVKYLVLDINLSTQILKIAREDYTGGICPSKFVNTTLDSTLFEYLPGYMNLTIFYGCLPTTTRGFSNSSCAIDGFPYGDVYAVPGALGPGECNTSVIVPVLHQMGFIEFLNLSVLDQLLRKGFEVKWRVDTACSNCITKSMGICGYDIQLKQTTCYCPNQTHPSTTCPSFRAPPGPTSKINLWWKVTIGVGGIIVASILLICCFGRKFLFKKVIDFWRKDTENDQNIETFIKNCGSLAPKRYSYSDVKRMTNSFKDKLGQGGFGGVYKGQLLDGCVVAVKLLSESKGNGEEFINEVASISRTSHVNIVTLLGFCYKRTKRALIYEFMPNGSLDKFIYDEGPHKANHPLEWNTLYQIAVGIARGLEYLHRGCNTRILHFDIKPHNILLDEDFCPKVSDFGLAKLCQRKDSIISMLGARGTAGYIAPEVFSRSFGGVSHKSDVYSYGMMVLEMVGGRKKIEIEESRTSDIYFPHWIYKQLDLSEDLRLHGVMTEEEGEISRKMVLVGLWCIQTIPSDRPSMSKVLDMLEGSLESLQVPPKPFLSSPPRPPQHSSTTSLS